MRAARGLVVLGMVLGTLCVLVSSGAAHDGAAHYTVRAGDTLLAIAQRAGVPIRALMDVNGIDDPDHIRVGARLALPGSVGGRTGSGTRHHQVRPGENLTRIAATYRVSPAALADANGIRDPNRLLAGQVLRVPRTETTAPVSPDRGGVARLLEQTARRYGWSPRFVKAVAWQESGWNQGARSRTGAVGIMQVMPDTGRFVSRELLGRTLDLRDPADNVEAGVAFLDYLYRLTGRDPELTLAGYYQGLASVRRHGQFTDTRRYVTNVLALRARFG